jgi:hypothetical protein
VSDEFASGRDLFIELLAFWRDREEETFTWLLPATITIL